MDLGKLNEKIKSELGDLSDPDFDKDFAPDEDFAAELDDDSDIDPSEEEEGEESGKSNTKVRIYADSELKVRGYIQNMDFEIVYDDFKNAVHEKMSGIVLSREKTHQMVDIFREMLGF
jgi:hypothetical protein